MHCTIELDFSPNSAHFFLIYQHRGKCTLKLQREWHGYLGPGVKDFIVLRPLTAISRKMVK